MGEKYYIKRVIEEKQYKVRGTIWVDVVVEVEKDSETKIKSFTTTLEIWKEEKEKGFVSA
jgi:hypothetical protein